MMDPMPKPIPASTKTSLHQRLLARQPERWPAAVQVRFHGRFTSVDGELAGGEMLPLSRLRHLDSASMWGFAIYLASRNGYQNSVLPSGRPLGTPQQALDCTSRMYLNDPSTWQQSRPPAGP
jgi:hypothetical protein